jgi:hypothetical protein
MLSDNIVVATVPPASWRNLRRLTDCIRITSLLSAGNTQRAALP